MRLVSLNISVWLSFCLNSAVAKSFVSFPDMLNCKMIVVSMALQMQLKQRNLLCGGGGSSGTDGATTSTLY